VIGERALGGTGLQIPVLGFGSAPIGNLYASMEDAQALAAVDKARECGLRYFDTAPFYGFGLSEKRLADLGAEVVISTKVGRLLKPCQAASGLRHGYASSEPYEPVFDYSYDAVMRSFESSLRRLKRERIHILLAHDLGELTHGTEHQSKLKEFMDGGYKAMSELKRAGQIDAIGLGVNEWQVAKELSRHVDLDCVLIAGRYSLLEQEVIEHFFPICLQRDIALIIGGPFNSGILAQGSGADGLHYNYEAAPDNVVEKVRAIENVCREFALPLPAAALQFPNLNSQVTSTVAGFADADQVQQAIDWWQIDIPNEFWCELQRQNLIVEGLPL
jgi:D-threo-aldose 1-dehydrogenase